MLTMLAIASYFKGDRFLRQAHARGVKVYLLTQAKHLGKPWPREALTDLFKLRLDRLDGLDPALATVAARAA